MSGARKLYDLAAADSEVRFSPYCWRTKLALAHKGLTTETIPWRFIEKDVIAFSGSKLVPVLIDGEKTVSDSQVIAEYLEATYPDAPSLFGDARSTRFDVIYQKLGRDGVESGDCESGGAGYF